jgi:hypothetical protein
MPAFDVQTWGDYPHYVERTRLAMVHCNADRESALLFLRQQAFTTTGFTTTGFTTTHATTTTD